ncbi:heat shock 70 kDa protein 12A-like [Mercenaria mercenaria]|uniref:heat shock 70 kDa protein 12A-like n=1 Tax=Mercenaria mercenaria TaxID=6596 RepID=UPI00234F35C3|nr:heat shock 70 kDa protein 12A-like [Mercenaria mercenaria]
MTAWIVFNIYRYTVGDKYKYFIMAAIEIGNSRCCYSFGFCGLRRGPNNVYTNNGWRESDKRHSGKIRLAVLFDEKKVFHSFGFHAEDKYAELSVNNEHSNWHFFREFKTVWHGKRIHSDIEINDTRGKAMKAVDVFGAIIGYLKKDLFRHVFYSSSQITEEDLTWILSVPDSLPFDAHLIIKEAAYKAGIYEDQLSETTESVAALSFCLRMPKSEMLETCGAETNNQESTFVAINAGHDHTHISVYKQNQDNGLMELHNSSEGPWGGACVEEELYLMLTTIIGSSIHQILLDCDKFDVLDFQRTLTKNWMGTTFNEENVTIEVPVSIFKKCNDFMKQNIQEATKCSPYSKKVYWIHNRLRIHRGFFKNFFTPCTYKIAAHVQKIISNPGIVERSTVILLVGELPESPIFQDIIKKALPNAKFLIPLGPSKAVCRGAVLFGYKPIPVASYFSKNARATADESITEALANTFHCGISPLLFH